ncbi:MAG: phthalate 4,5-dioxygenase [Chloroflexi bacterium]|nr:phthalate 4,5-dioxygenase [Chloroflexota bacterium]
MLTREENERLTIVGPHTPGGELLRRYWQPAALSEELPPGGAPLPVRLLCEDLVLFRDEHGQPGLLGIHCAHRGADLSYGRVEDAGLRCIYHGWLYDIHGRCLEQPGEPAGSTFHERVRHLAYPCQEVGGLILAYLGPGTPPLVPAYEFLQAPVERRFNTKIYQECSYLQANEGNTDSVHVPFLHRVAGRWGPSPSSATRRIEMVMEPEETEFGVRVLRMEPRTDDTVQTNIGNFIMPNLSAIPAGRRDGYEAVWHVPIDDESHWKYAVQFNRSQPMDREREGDHRAEMTADYRLLRNRANRYLQDREEMKGQAFAGLGNCFQTQDACATEGQGAIQDRTQEHLGSTDRAILLIRTMLLRAIGDVQAGREAPHVVRDPAANHFPNLLVWTERVPASTDWRAHLRAKIAACEAQVDPG